MARSLLYNARTRFAKVVMLELLKKWGKGALDEPSENPGKQSDHLLDRQDKRSDRALRRTTVYLTSWGLLGSGFLYIFSESFSCAPSSECPYSVSTIFSSGMLLALASASLGGLFGFLFGVPRTQKKEKSAVPDQGDKSTSKTSNISDRPSPQGVNTNLEEISDWLTKILVGAGLVQLQALGPLLQKVAGHFSSSLGNSELVVLAIILNFTIWGFFSGYLFTRLFLAGAFAQAAVSDVLADVAFFYDQEQKGKALAEAGEFDKSRMQYQVGLQKVDPSTPKDVKRRMYEGFIFNCLYQDPPQGLTNAINHSLQFLSEEPETPAPLIWAYLGYAYGQQYKYIKLSQPSISSAELDAIRDKSYDAIKRAVTLQPALKSSIRAVWDPSDPAKSPGDDDLEVFKDDSKFQELLG